jgi:hypothetical protein
MEKPLMNMQSRELCEKKRGSVSIDFCRLIFLVTKTARQIMTKEEKILQDQMDKIEKYLLKEFAKADKMNEWAVGYLVVNIIRFSSFAMAFKKNMPLSSIKDIFNDSFSFILDAKQKQIKKLKNNKAIN